MKNNRLGELAIRLIVDRSGLTTAKRRRKKKIKDKEEESLPITQVAS
jgi:hypothetical protein